MLELGGDRLPLRRVGETDREQMTPVLPSKVYEQNETSGNEAGRHLRGTS